MDPIESLLNKKLDQLQSEIDRLDSSPRVAAKLSFIKSLIAAETSGATGDDTSIRLGHIAARVAALESSLSAPKIEPCEKSAPKNPLFIDGCDDFQKKIETLKRFSSAGSDFSDLSQAIDEAIAANASSSSSSLSSSCSCTSSCFDGGEEKCATGINGTGELCFAETLKEVEENAESGKRFGRVFSAAVVAVAVAVAAAGVLVASFFNEEDVIYLVPTLLFRWRRHLPDPENCPPPSPFSISASNIALSDKIHIPFPSKASGPSLSAGREDHWQV